MKTEKIKNEKLAEVEVSLSDLRDLEKKPTLKTVLDFLDEFWVGKFREREISVKVGTVTISINKDNNLEMNFTTKFSLVNHPELLEKLKEDLK